MSKFLSEVKGFTPVIDVLAKEMGLMTAVVYGIVWRYCQMEDKRCTASRERIAKHAGISSKTVERHLKILCKNGYLKDLTPDYKHRPHEYADTGKAKIKGLLTVEIGETESPTSEQGETESPKGKTESPTRSDAKSSQGETESPTRIPSYDSLHDSSLGEKEGNSDFPEKNPVPPAPSPGGGAALADDAAIVEEIIAQTESHPDQFTLGRITEIEREKAGGNYAVPPCAGGADAFRGGPVDAFCEVLAGINPLKLPPELRESWGDKLREIAKKCDAASEVMERAIRAIPEDQIGWKTFSSPYSDNFEDNVIPLLLRDGKPRQKGDRHGNAHQRDRGRIAQGAVRREVATEEEARAILG